MVEHNLRDKALGFEGFSLISAYTAIFDELNILFELENADLMF
jgi:hypothetical protein